MISPEEPQVPQSWQKVEGHDEDSDAEVMERLAQTREYVEHYLPEASVGMRDLAEVLVTAEQSDLDNENYWNVGLSERLQVALSPEDIAQLEAFIRQLKRDRGWSEEPLATAEESGADTSEPDASQPEDLQSTETSEKPPFTDVVAAREAFIEQSEAMNAELNAIERTDDEYDTFKELMEVLKRYAVTIELENGKVVTGLPSTLGDSGVPEERYSEWGENGGSRVSTGSLATLNRNVIAALERQKPFTVREALDSMYLPRAVEETIDRLFS